MHYVHKILFNHHGVFEVFLIFFFIFETSSDCALRANGPDSDTPKTEVIIVLTRRKGTVPFPLMAPVGLLLYSKVM